MQEQFLAGLADLTAFGSLILLPGLGLNPLNQENQNHHQDQVQGWCNTGYRTHRLHRCNRDRQAVSRQEEFPPCLN